jgi:hypothetical protein
MFKPDRWGNTFMFVDLDFNFDKQNPGLIYVEIAREFQLGNFPLLPHIEYNGGLGLARGTDIGLSYNFVGTEKFYAFPTIGAKWNF